MTEPTCASFELALEELAIGHVEEPDRSRLMAHASACSTCRTRLDATARLADTLLLLAPGHEPPAGFESRVLSRLALTDGPPAERAEPAAEPAARTDTRRRRSGRRGLVAAVAAVAIAAAVGLGVVVSLRSGDDGTVSRSGVITSASGNRVGDVELIADAHPYVVVTIDRPRTGGGEVWCDLVMADGRVVRVGSWDAEDVQANVWAVGIDPELLDAVGMNVVAEDGRVVATATLTN